jgi:hypothetical protein
VTVDLAQRSDADCVTVDDFASWNGSTSLVVDAPRVRNAVVFISEPFVRPTELSGLFAGRLDFVTNKRDFDFEIQLYEQTPDGKFILLSFFASRASHVRDLEHRHLLGPGRRERLDFESRTLTSRQLSAGSRVVAVLALSKRCDVQLDYGTGKDVSDETIADAGAPLTVDWSRESSVRLPLRR